MSVLAAASPSPNPRPVFSYPFRRFLPLSIFFSTTVLFLPPFSPVFTPSLIFLTRTGAEENLTEERSGEEGANRKVGGEMDTKRRGVEKKG
jgi:hypothetical protein